MQTKESEQERLPVTPADPESQPLPTVPFAREDDEDDPEQIFIRAVAEIETQPLPGRKRTGSVIIADVLQTVFCVSLIGIGLFGIIWQCITYPHTLVVLYTRAIPAHVTTTLDLQTRTVAPITLTRSATTATSGTGHQDARAATGQVNFYNGSYVSQTIHAGTVFTGRNGVQVELLQTVTIPAASPPQFGETNVTAQAVHVGAGGNIAPYDITLALSNFLTVKNPAAFTGGRDARTYRAVAAQDLTTLTTTVNATLTQAFTTAFSLQPGEAALPTNCHVMTSANHQVGEEAQSVTFTASKTCLAVAYKQDELTRAAIATFTKTRPGATYHIVGSIQTHLLSVSPLTVSLNGKWAYTFSQDYKQLLAQGIQGESPAKARASLLKTGIISYASVPQTLPSAGYIDFLVLVG